MSLGGLCGVLVLLATSTEAASQPSEPASEPAEEEAYEPAKEPAKEPAQEPGKEVKAVPVKMESRWAATFYGFVQAMGIFDSTQSFKEQEANSLVARPDTYAGNHRRFQTTVRNSRFGFKLTSPEFSGMKASGVTEFDFLGNQPSDASEASFFNNPTVRVRHYYLKLETGWFDLLAGQYWAIVGWQPLFFPGIGEIQAVPNQIYGRAVQLRLSRLFKGDAVSFEIAAAALRPPQRDSAVPEGQAGVRIIVNGWRGAHSSSYTETKIDPLSVGVSGGLRRFAVKEFSATPTTEQIARGWVVSLDALIPIIPANGDSKGNTLTFTGSFFAGEGFGDLASNLSGGVGWPMLPNMTAFKPNIDDGIVTYDAGQKLTPIEWHAFLVGLNYFFPGSGWLGLGVAYSQANSDNIANLGLSAKALVNQARWGDASIFADVLPGVRFAVDGEFTISSYVDGVDATSYRGQFQALYAF